MAQTSHMQSVNIGDGNANCGNITGSYNTTITYADKSAKLLNWLSPLQPRVRHNDVRGRRDDGIGEWFCKPMSFSDGVTANVNSIRPLCFVPAILASERPFLGRKNNYFPGAFMAN